MRMLRRSPASCHAIAVAGWLLVVFAVPSGAEDWEPVAGALGRDPARFALHIGGSFGTMEGSELSKVGASSGFDVGVSARIFASLSVVGYYAVDTADVDGQLVQLLDEPVRADGRSGLVTGQVQTSRFRAGLRTDGYRERGWRYNPYFLLAVVFSEIEVTIDSVDGKPPKPVPTAGAGSQAVDISKITEKQIGALGRGGVELRILHAVAFDVSGNYEIIETEPGTNSIFAVNTGLVFRF